MSEPLDSRFDPKKLDSVYSKWESAGFFRPSSDRTPDKAAKENLSKNKYVIVIPPPNVTGILHMGHALNNTIQDIMTRWNRMKGKDALWIPGVDHAVRPDRGAGLLRGSVCVHGSTNARGRLGIQQTGA